MQFKEPGSRTFDYVITGVIALLILAGLSTGTTGVFAQLSGVNATGAVLLLVGTVLGIVFVYGVAKKFMSGAI